MLPLCFKTVLAPGDSLKLCQLALQDDITRSISISWGDALASFGIL
jgi:hypothetical protein